MPAKKTTKKTVKKQRGGNCPNYALISEAFPKSEDIIKEVKSIMNDSLEGTKPMTEPQAAETVELVVDTVKTVAPEVSKVDIQDAVIESISENNVQNGGKRIRKSYVKSKSKTKKTSSKKKTKTKKTVKKTTKK